MDQRVCDVMRMLREQESPPQQFTGRNLQTSRQEKQKMSLEEMAERVELSESRLRVVFKAETALTPTQFVMKIKMDSAADLLRNTYWRVNKIASRLGASSDSRFARDFKKVYDMTPTKYRKLHQRRGEGEGGAEGAASS